MTAISIGRTQNCSSRNAAAFKLARRREGRGAVRESGESLCSARLRDLSFLVEASDAFKSDVEQILHMASELFDQAFRRE